MPDYGLVAREINNLSNRIGNITARNQSNDLALANLDYNQKNIEGQQGLQMAKLQREKWLTEPVTIGQAIDTHPKWSPEQKQAIKMSMPEKERDSILNHPATRGTLNATLEKLSQQSKEDQYKQQMLALRGREVTAKEKEPRDNRSNMQKEVEYIRNVKGVSPIEALAEWQKSKSLPERIRLYNNELTALNEDLTISPKDKPSKVEQLRQLYGISDAMNQPQQAPQGSSDYIKSLVEKGRQLKGQ